MKFVVTLKFFSHLLLPDFCLENAWTASSAQHGSVNEIHPESYYPCK